MGDNKKAYQDFIKANHGFSEDELIIRKHTSITDLDFDTLKLLFEFRNWPVIIALGIKMLVTSAYRDGDDGAHGEGKAFDLVLFSEWLWETIEPMQLWLLATTFPWRGVGIYFDWKYVNKKGEEVPCVGIHVDNSRKGNRPLRWLRITKKVEGVPTKLYYYQDTTTGLFYNRKLKEVMELEDAISGVRTK